MKQFLAEIKTKGEKPQFNIWEHKRKKIFNVTVDTISVTNYDESRHQGDVLTVDYLFHNRGLRDINDLVNLSITGSCHIYPSLYELFSQRSFPKNLKHLSIES